MAKYEINNELAGTQQAMTATYKSLLTLASSATTKRLRLYEVSAAQNGVPASSDTNIEFDISRVTAAGTGTAITALAVDSGDGAALASCLANLTVEPTVTAASSVWARSGNQRAPFYWAAVDASAHLISPATSAAGFALRCKSAGYTSTAKGSIYFEE